MLIFRPSAPKLPVEHAVVDRFADVLRQDVGSAVEVGDRAGDAEDFVVGPGREAHLLDAASAAGSCRRR